MKNWLFTEEGRQFLQHEYCDNKKSPYEIAELRHTYANAIRRALKHHGIPIRDKKEAQEIALSQGRAKHPTSGVGHDEEAKAAISDGITDSWLKRKNRV